MEDKNNFKTQVDKNHYSNNYDTLERFIGYFYQIDIIKKLKPKKILEIGVGNKTTSNYLRAQGIEVHTCDFDQSLNPDILADVRNIPIKEPTYDLVACFEILEHIPFKEVPKAIESIANASKKHVVISIPYAAMYIEFLIRFPLIKKITGKSFIRIFPYIPLFTHKFLGKEHYWELGRKGYSKNKIRKELKKKFIIKKEFRPPIDTFHYFFILEKK